MTKLLVFPGQGSQYSGMGKDWFENFTAAKLTYEEASDACGLKLKKLCFDGPDYDLAKTEVTQPAILCTSVAIYRSLQSVTDKLNVSADKIFAGHSLGEYSALVAGGALSLSEAAKLVRLRGQYMTEACAPGLGGMMALVFKPKTPDTWAKAQKFCEEASQKSGMSLSVANLNTPEQIVVAGHTQALEMAETLWKNEDYSIRKVVPLKVSGPFHSALMQKAADRLQVALDNCHFKSVPNFRYIANVDAALYSLNSDTKGIAERLTQQVTHSVLWVPSVLEALSLGAETSVEFGPGAVLSGMNKRIHLEALSLKTIGLDRVEEFKTQESQL